MAFGIGTNTQKTEHEALQGTYRDVAVDCWFTVSGKTRPVMLKMQTEEGEIMAIHNIQLLTMEKQRYAGILNLKYRCQAVLRGQKIEFTLLFCPEECTWKLVV